jgi:hypothetical protein
VPLNLWLSEGAVLAVGVTLGITVWGYAKAQRMLREVERDPRMHALIPRVERTVTVHRGAIAFMAMALLLVVRVYLGNLGVYPFSLPAE